jgi:ribonuclease VapC
LILDSSAVIAVLLREQGHRRLADAMDSADAIAIGAPTLLETGMVMVGKFGLRGRALVSQFLEERGVVVISFDDRHWRSASDAFIRYGKGRHSAGLNYGDCMTYATARLSGASLLFVGEDFAKTDLIAAFA